MWPIWQIVVGIIALWVALQVAIITVLSLSARRRLGRQLTAGFPHPRLPEAHVGANHLHIYP
jgi:hypothetical protein